jgi:hypothetical protein
MSSTPTELPDEDQYEEPTEFAPEPANNGIDSKVQSSEDFGGDEDDD